MLTCRLASYKSFSLTRFVLLLDMFCPTQLVVSIQGTFVLIDTVDGRNEEDVKSVPANLMADVREGTNPVRNYE